MPRSTSTRAPRLPGFASSMATPSPAAACGGVPTIAPPGHWVNLLRASSGPQLAPVPVSKLAPCGRSLGAARYRRPRHGDVRLAQWRGRARGDPGRPRHAGPGRDGAAPLRGALRLPHPRPLRRPARRAHGPSDRGRRGGPARASPWRSPRGGRAARSGAPPFHCGRAARVGAASIFSLLAAALAAGVWAWPHLFEATRLWIWDDYTYHMIYPALWLRDHAIAAPTPAHAFTMQAWYPLAASAVAAWFMLPFDGRARGGARVGEPHRTAVRRDHRGGRGGPPRSRRVPAGLVGARRRAVPDVGADRRHGLELLGRGSRPRRRALRRLRVRRAPRRRATLARRRRGRGTPRC